MLLREWIKLIISAGLISCFTVLVYPNEKAGLVSSANVIASNLQTQ